MWFGLELNEFSRVSLEAGECSSLLDLNNRRPLCLSLWINPVYGKEGYLRLNRTQLLISVDGVNDNPLIRNALDDGFFVLNKCHIVFFKKNEDSDLPYQHRSNLLIHLVIFYLKKYICQMILFLIVMMKTGITYEIL
jgi:hypothetical protein